MENALGCLSIVCEATEHFFLLLIKRRASGFVVFLFCYFELLFQLFGNIVYNVFVSRTNSYLMAAITN